MGGQMVLQLWGTAQDMKKQPIVASRSTASANTAIVEAEDIGPFQGARPFVPLNTGSSRCQCGRCGLGFSSVSYFDRHQRMTNAGALICRDPATLGMVKRGDFWGRPGPEDAPWRRNDDDAT